MVGKTEILKLKINTEELDEIIEESLEKIRKGQKHYICAPNAFLTVVANRDPEVLDIINNAGFVVPDGMPLVWYSRTKRKSLAMRISGYDLFYAYSKKLAEKKMSCFLLGGQSDQVVKEFIDKIKKDFNGIEVAGFFVPPYLPEFKGDIKKDIAKAINSSNPDVVWVGMSAPKQEKWIIENLGDLDIGMACGIGAVFDFYSGAIKRAPRWMQLTGLEWFHRMLMEPGRLSKKYLVYNTRFIGLVIEDLFRRIFKRPNR